MEVWNTGKSQKCNINVDNGSLLMEYEIGGLRLKYKMKTPISWLKCTIILANIHFFSLHFQYVVVPGWFFLNIIIHLSFIFLWPKCDAQMPRSCTSHHIQDMGKKPHSQSCIWVQQTIKQRKNSKTTWCRFVAYDENKPHSSNDLKRLKSEEARKFIIKLIANSLAPA